MAQRTGTCGKSTHSMSRIRASKMTSERGGATRLVLAK